MKAAKRLLALALAGVLMLALLTGCSGSGNGEDRLIAEAAADSFKSLYPKVEVSYDVPALTCTIRPAFTPDWFLKDGEGDVCGLDRDALTDAGLPLDDFLKDSLKAYAQSNFVCFAAFDSTGMGAYEQAEQFTGGAPSLTVYYKNMSPASNTQLRVGVCHKTIGGREYCLVVFALA